MLISNDSLNELEFPKILDEIKNYAFTEIVKNRIKKLLPITEIQIIKDDLKKVNEYLSSIESNNVIPFNEFEDISNDLKVMGIENYQLSEKTFLNIFVICQITNELKKYFSKFYEYYPTLNELFNTIEFKKEIPLEIIKIINKFGEVKSTASKELALIRSDISISRKKIQENFSQSLTHYTQLGYLDDIRESFIDNKRVLAVKSAYKRKVKGRVFGESKSGSICFIEPENILKYSLKLNDLLEAEKKEISRILKALTAFLNEYKEDITLYFNILLEIDFIQAKAKYSNKIKGVLPQINESKIYLYKDA